MANLSYRYVCAIVLINFIDLCFLMTSIVLRASASSTSTRCLLRPRKCCLCTSLRNILLFSTDLLHSFLFYASSYLGAEFPKILDKKELVEYKQVNLTIPGTSCLARSVSGSSTLIRSTRSLTHGLHLSVVKSNYRNAEHNSTSVTLRADPFRQSCKGLRPAGGPTALYVRFRPDG